MTDYTHRCFIFVNWDKLVPANAQAKAWEPYPEDDPGDTFGLLRLSANGLEPPTQTGCDTPATNGMRTQILVAFEHVPFYKIYLTADGWTWESALADAGLQVIQGGI